MRKLYLDVLHVPTLIGIFWKTSNPRNFQTNNIEKFSQEPKDRVFQELSNDVSQVPKIVNLKIVKNGGKQKKSGPSTKSLPKILLGWNNKTNNTAWFAYSRCTSITAWLIGTLLCLIYVQLCVIWTNFWRQISTKL